MKVNEKAKKILTFLISNSTNPLSGEEMAQRLGISRVALWKHIKSLQENHCPIVSTSRGYLFQRNDSRADLWERLIDEEGLVEFHCSSILNESLRQAELGAPEGTLLLAHQQSEGRDRQNNLWESPPGGFYGGLILRPPWPLLLTGILQPLGALGLAQCLGEGYGCAWPGDVLTPSGIKGGGVLMEIRGTLNRTEWIVLGMGITPATLNSAHGNTKDRHLLAKTLKELFLSWCYSPDAPELTKARKEFTRRSGQELDPLGALICNKTPTTHQTSPRLLPGTTKEITL